MVVAPSETMTVSKDKGTLTAELKAVPPNKYLKLNVGTEVVLLPGLTVILSIESVFVRTLVPRVVTPDGISTAVNKELFLNASFLIVFNALCGKVRSRNVAMFANAEVPIVLTEEDEPSPSSKVIDTKFSLPSKARSATIVTGNSLISAGI